MKHRLRLSLGAWRRIERKLDPSLSALTVQTRFMYTVSGACQSFLARIQDASHAEALKTVAILPPVFLLGFWRSGTTFLHELISCDPRFGFPSTYACLNPAHFLLTEQWVQKGQSQQKRPMDEMRYSWSSPQEDEFALLSMGAPSPYEALIAPSLMSDPRALVDFGQLSAEDKMLWHSALQHFLQLLTLQQGKPMVLKSPPHGFRLSTLISLFPGARYILIERNPYEVFASNLKLWRTLTELYSLESASAEKIENFVIEAYLAHEEAIASGTKLAMPNTFARVRYEDLLIDPIAQVERLYQELDLQNFERVRPHLEEYVVRVADHKRNRFRICAAQKQRIDEQWRDVIRAKRYAWPDEYVMLEEIPAA